MYNCLNKSIMKPKRFYFARWQILVLLLVLLVIGCRALSIPELALLTATPSATATPQPTMTPIPGWKKFEGDHIEIWLPESFVGGDLSENSDLMLEQAKTLGPEYESYVQTFLQNPSMFSLWAYDSDIGLSPYLTNLGITTDRLSYSVPLDTYVDESVSQFPDEMHLRERGRVTLNGREAQRLVVEIELPDATAMSLMYLLMDGKTVWMITYTTGPDEYEERVPVFEQSANTFNTMP